MQDNPTRIKNFLLNFSPQDLRNLYREGFLTVVRISEDYRVTEDDSGSRWIESKAQEERSLEAEFDRIGMNGWNYREKLSYWVVFDFDSKEDHGGKCADIDETIEKLKSLPYTTIRRSRRGNGIHAYVFFADPVVSITKPDHVALAKAVFEKMKTDSGFDFSGVDTIGQMVWIGDRQLAQDGFSLIRAGEPLSEVPQLLLTVA
jgi:hypothetical protein